MESMKLSLVVFVLSLCQALTAQGDNCMIQSDLSGRITDKKRAAKYEKCWTIQVPQNSFVTFDFLKLYIENCEITELKISVPKTGDIHNFCQENKIYTVTAMTDVNITVITSTNYHHWSDFILEYKIQEIKCLYENIFRCDRHSCVSRNKVCDGVKDCKNGEDEKGCRTVLSINEVAEAREAAILWLKSKRTPSWGWRENTHWAVVALYLAAGANFDGTSLEDELMAKQAELETAAQLLRSPIPNNQLGTMVNSLLVTCHNPRNFYATDMVKSLKAQIDLSESFTHPSAYLALCNANESLSTKDITDLDRILSSDSEYPFIRDYQALAIMALSCVKERGNDSANNTLYEDTIQHFEELQLEDGSFGNVHSTALIVQALISSGQEHNMNWNLKAAIKYLIHQLNSSNDFYSTYLTLPILNGKSLVDIGRINCSGVRRHGNDPVSEIAEKIGPKMRIQYSLYIGDEKDTIHTIFLRVPENYTAYQIMKEAAEDAKFNFEWKRISGKMYVYQISRVINNPEVGKFWLLYVASANSESLKHLTTSPDELILEDEEHLVLWYKTAHI